MRQPELSSCLEPIGKVIALGMVKNTLDGRGFDFFFQRDEICCSADFCAPGQTKFKIAKTKVFIGELTKLIEEGGGLL